VLTDFLSYTNKRSGLLSAENKKSLSSTPSVSNPFNMVRILTFLLFATTLLNSCTQEQPVPKKPNIIYILADDLGYGDLGVYGQQKIETPNIDALAQSGMRFTQHYSGAPVCAPARYMLMTGQHPGHAHIRGNDEWRERGEVWNYEAAVLNPQLEGQRPISDSTITIGEILQSAGYTTGIVGKWGLGAPGTEGTPNRQGFDFFYGYNCQRQAHNLYPPFLWKNDKKEWLENEVVAPGTKLQPGADTLDEASYALFQQKDYAPTLMEKEALGFIETNKDSSFFLYYASPIPHLPLQAPEELVQYYVDKFGDEKPYVGGRGYFPCRYPRATYAAMVTYLDQQVGEIVHKLKSLGIYENTLIIFTSDNGPTYNVGGFDPTYFNSAAPFENGYGWTKGFTHEGGIRVPMIASWPGKIEANSETDHISAFWDVLPTMAKITDTSVPASVDGVSFLPTLLSLPNDQLHHDHLYWEFPAYGGQQAVRIGDWKGIRKNIQKDSLTIALYNLKTDLKEQNDVAAENPDIVAQIKAIMESEHTPATIARFNMKALGD
jgi:arylsulfatase A-like enzyme